MQFIKEKINKTFGYNYENHIYYIKMEPGRKFNQESRLDSN